MRRGRRWLSGSGAAGRADTGKPATNKPPASPAQVPPFMTVGGPPVTAGGITYRLNSWTETPSGPTATSTDESCGSLSYAATGCDTLVLNLTVSAAAGADMPPVSSENAEWVTPGSMIGGDGESVGNFVPVNETGTGSGDLNNEILTSSPVTATLTYVVPDTPGYLSMFASLYFPSEQSFTSGVTELGATGGVTSPESVEVYFTFVNPGITRPSQYLCNLATTGCAATP